MRELTEFEKRCSDEFLFKCPALHIDQKILVMFSRLAQIKDKQYGNGEKLCNTMAEQYCIEFVAVYNSGLGLSWVPNREIIWELVDG